MCDAPVKIHIGRELTEGLGSGVDLDTGCRVRRRSRFITTGAPERYAAPTWCSSPPERAGAPAPARRPSWRGIARELGALAVGIVTMPFRFEGTRRKAAADTRVDAAARHPATR